MGARIGIGLVGLLIGAIIGSSTGVAFGGDAVNGGWVFGPIGFVIGFLIPGQIQLLKDEGTDLSWWSEALGIVFGGLLVVVWIAWVLWNWLYSAAIIAITCFGCYYILEGEGGFPSWVYEFKLFTIPAVIIAACVLWYVIFFISSIIIAFLFALIDEDPPSHPFYFNKDWEDLGEE